MKSDKIPVDFSKFKPEKMKNSLVEAIEMMKEVRMIPMSKNLLLNGLLG